MFVLISSAFAPKLSLIDTLGSLQTIQIPFGDLGPMIQRIEGALRGSTLEEALYKLALITAPVDPGALRTQVEKVIADNPLHALFNTTVLDAAGRTVGVAPPALAGTDEERERGLRFHMHRHAGLHRDLACAGYIGPGLRIISDEHAIDEESIAAILVGHPLVPDGHENFFLRGVVEGIRGDFAVALHLLIPQIENALRIILHANGVITSDLDQAGIELEWTLGRLISQDALKEAIGESLVFELGDLLTSESFGSNIRNTMAHGLLRYRALSTTESVYLWWIVLRLIVETSPQFETFAEAQVRARERTKASESAEPAEESNQSSLKRALDFLAQQYSKIRKAIRGFVARNAPCMRTN